MTLLHLQYDLTMTQTDQLLNYILKESFDLPLPTAELLAVSVDYQLTKAKMFELLLKTERIVTNEEALEEWIALHHEEVKKRNAKVVPRRATKQEEEKVS